MRSRSACFRRPRSASLREIANKNADLARQSIVQHSTASKARVIDEIEIMKSQ